jgi:hypothetical protein
LAGAFSVLGSLLGRAMLVPISEVGSLTIALGWLATSLAFCGGAAGRLSIGAHFVGAAGVVVSTALIGITAWGFGDFEWRAVVGWVGLGVVLWLLPRRRQHWEPPEEQIRERKPPL